MMQVVPGRRFSALGFMALLPMLAASAKAQAATPVPSLDYKQFAGTWYEVARYPNKSEKGCIGNAIELIARGDKTNHLQLVHSCHARNGFTEVRNQNAKPQDKLGDGKLKVSTTFPFSSQYWVLAVAPDYSWSLLGTPNHKSLWVLSKTAGLSPEVFSQIQAKAAAQGFSPAKLVMSPQDMR